MVWFTVLFLLWFSLCPCFSRPCIVNLSTNFGFLLNYSLLACNLEFGAFWICFNGSMFEVKYPIFSPLYLEFWFDQWYFNGFYLIHCLIWVSNLWVKLGLITLYFAMVLVFLKFSVTKNLCTSSACVLKTHGFGFVPFFFNYFTWVLFEPS